MTCIEAQVAVGPNQELECILLDVGCGWVRSAKRVVEWHDVNVAGLTSSKNQHAYCQRYRHPTARTGTAERSNNSQRAGGTAS